MFVFLLPTHLAQYSLIELHVSLLMLSSAGNWEWARLEATAAAHSGAWLDALPSSGLDTQLSNAEVQYGVGRRLGVEVVRSTHAHSVGGSWTDGVHTVRVVWQGGIRQRVIILFGMIFICRPSGRTRRLSLKPLALLGFWG